MNGPNTCWIVRTVHSVNNNIKLIHYFVTGSTIRSQAHKYHFRFFCLFAFSLSYRYEVCHLAIYSPTWLVNTLAKLQKRIMSSMWQENWNWLPNIGKPDSDNDNTSSFIARMHILWFSYVNSVNFTRYFVLYMPCGRNIISVLKLRPITILVRVRVYQESLRTRFVRKILHTY